MREFVRPAATALSIACLAAASPSYPAATRWRRPSSRRQPRARPRRRRQAPRSSRWR